MPVLKDGPAYIFICEGMVLRIMSEKKHILDYDTVALDDENRALVIIDQTQLPYHTEILHLTSQKQIWEAIYKLQVRGAPAIGVAAGYGVYLAAREIQAESYDDFCRQFKEASAYLNSSRPTAVNLSCQLATSKYGTATAPMYLGHERGYNFHVFCDETRPLLQGARLTAYELKDSGLNVTLICDNMSASVMKKGWVNAVFVGCDRVAANGDTANKIGTSVVATVANYYHVPFYICAPTSTIDMNTPTGEQINIEQRPAEEVTELWYQKRMAPEGVDVYNPAFDVTDAGLITGIVTEYGIARPPYTESLKAIMEKKAKEQV